MQKNRGSGSGCLVGEENRVERSYPTEGIRKLRKGVYEINFRYGAGRRYQKRHCASSLQEAKSIRRELMGEYIAIFKNGGIEKADVDFSRLKEQLVRDLEGDGLRKKTISRCLNAFDTFFAKFLPLHYPNVNRLGDLSTTCFYDYKNYIVNDLMRTKGWRSELGTLRGIFSRLVKLGFCKKEINEGLKEIKRPPTNQVEYKEITKEDKVKLLEHIRDNRSAYYGVTYMLIRLGWRIEETLSIKRKNIKMRDGEPVSITLEASIRKNGKSFTLESIDAGLARVIKQYLQNGRQSQWLFMNSRRNKIKADHYRNYLTRISEKVIGKRITLHDFRRSLVTELARAGVPVKDIMAITGHTDMKVLLKYYSFSTEQGRRKVLSMSEV